MNIKKITLILRGYSLEEVLTIAKEASQYDCFGLEITTNTSGWEEIIHETILQHFPNITVGAGTVLNMTLLEKAINAGAQFVLSPIMMDSEMLETCRRVKIDSVPSGFSPSEIWEMASLGADVVKIFPAARLTPKYISDILAPLGKLPIMVVGGVNSSNVVDFFKAGALFAGIGSGLGDRDKIKSGEISELQENLKNLSEIAHSDKS
jgi:2-dehydro-3-deoxyphosphogluconate aldolase/(4S)-4-hydroxy-2-oxoglutarate aldolase